MTTEYIQRPIAPDGGAWLPSTGSDNWACVDEAVSNDDTDYSYTNSRYKTQTAEVAGAGVGAGVTIEKVSVTVNARGATQACTIALGVVYPGSGGNIVTAAGNLGTSYGLKTVDWLTNPWSGSPWTPGEVNRTSGTYQLAAMLWRTPDTNTERRVTQIWISVFTNETPPVPGGIAIMAADYRRRRA